MTRYRSLFLKLLLFAGFATLAHIVTGHLSDFTIAKQAEAEKLPPSRTSTSYLVDKEEWVSFLLPPGEKLVKVVTNANVHRSDYKDTEVGCSYAFRYELFDAEENLLKESEYWLRGYSSTQRMGNVGERVPSHFYLGGELSPLGSRTALIRLDSLPREASVLRLRLGPKDPIVRNMTLRLYHVERPAEYKMRYLWQRTPRSKRDRLARANVYSSDLLTADEKRNLISRRWVALAPRGIDGQDYQQRKLYTSRLGSSARSREPILPQGLYISPHAIGSIAIPRDPVCVVLKLYTIDADEGELSGGDVHLTWYGDDEEQTHEVVTLGEVVVERHLDLEGGFLEIVAPDGVVARAFVAAFPADIEITPNLGSVPSYVLGSETYLDFYVGGDGVSSRPLRIDVRSMTPDVFTSMPERGFMEYLLLGDGDQVLERGTLEHDQPRTFYDRLVGSWRGRHLSSVSRFYFWLPPRCVRLRLVAGASELAVSGYTTLTGLARRVQVPAVEAHSSRERRADNPGSWFSVKPENYPLYVQQEREAFVKRQPRASRMSAAPRVETYHTVQHPRESATLQRVLTSVKVDEPGEDGPSFPAGRLLEVDNGVETELLLGAGEFDEPVQPRLFVVGPGGKPAPLTVTIDDRIVLKTTVAGRTTRLSLPPFPPGTHRVRVSTSSSRRLFLNYAHRPDGDYFLKRTAHVLDGRGLTYRIHKKSRDRETLIFRLYELGRNATTRPRLRVDVRPVKRSQTVTRSWTYTGNEYQIQQRLPQECPILWTDQVAYGGEPFFLGLGADLDPGTYDIEVKLEEGSACLLQLKQSTPVKSSTRRLSVQPGRVEKD